MVSLTHSMVTGYRPTWFASHIVWPQVTGLLSDLLVWVGQHVEEAIEEDGEVREQVDVGHRVEGGDPAHEELGRWVRRWVNGQVRR